MNISYIQTSSQTNKHTKLTIQTKLTIHTNPQSSQNRPTTNGIIITALANKQTESHPNIQTSKQAHKAHKQTCSQMSKQQQQQIVLFEQNPAPPGKIRGTPNISTPAQYRKPSWDGFMAVCLLVGFRNIGAQQSCAFAHGHKLLQRNPER